MRGSLRRSSFVAAAALVVLGLTGTACGDSDVTTLSSPPTTDTSLTLTVQRSPVGSILATGAGNTLYDFAPDSPTQSACVNDGCVFQWPPLVVDRPVRVAKDLDPSLVGTLKRPDGATQVSYGGHPLYTYNLDVTPGMVMGQAIDQDGGLWYVIDPEGKQITTSFTVQSPDQNG
jgi:predicted lipoprotein with Yx(FWY)xxD motif